MKTCYLNISLRKSNKTNLRRVADVLMNGHVTFRASCYDDPKVAHFILYAFEDSEMAYIELLIHNNQTFLLCGAWLTEWVER